MHTDTTFRYLSIVASSFRNCEAHYIPADIEKLYQIEIPSAVTVRRRRGSRSMHRSPRKTPQRKTL
ncbi:unnamed protein product, partial [Musa acuminata subsp. burmannicoides]